MALKDLTIHRSLHGEPGAQQSCAVRSTSLCLVSDCLADVQPWNRRTVDEVRPGEMARVVGTNGEVRASAGHYLGRGEHEFTNRLIVSGIECGHPFPHGDRIQSDARVIVVANILL